MPMLKQLHKKTLLSKKKKKKSHFAQTCIWRNKIGMAAKKNGRRVVFGWPPIKFTKRG